MLISTANIKHGTNPMVQWKVKRDVKTAKSRSGIVGWQEIKSARYKDAVRTVYRDDWETCQLASPIPISVRASNFKILKSGRQLTHHGRLLTSPDRYVSWAYVQCRDNPFKFIVMNTHYVSGAWNDKPKLHKAWRQRMWEVHWRQQQTLVLDAYKAGYSIIGTGDFNRVEVKRFHPDQVWLTKGGIDKLWYLQGAHGPRFHQLGDLMRFDLFSDHDLKVARVRLH